MKNLKGLHSMDQRVAVYVPATLNTNEEIDNQPRRRRFCGPDYGRGFRRGHHPAGGRVLAERNRRTGQGGNDHCLQLRHPRPAPPGAAHDPRPVRTPQKGHAPGGDQPGGQPQAIFRLMGGGLGNGDLRYHELPRLSDLAENKIEPRTLSRAPEAESHQKMHHQQPAAWSLYHAAPEKERGHHEKE